MPRAQGKVGQKKAGQATQVEIVLDHQQAPTRLAPFMFRAPSALLRSLTHTSLGVGHDRDGQVGCSPGHGKYCCKALGDFLLLVFSCKPPQHNLPSAQFITRSYSVFTHEYNQW
jgi:hypothetical protein